MANYFYNGVALPELPADPKGQYMTIMTCPVYGYRLWCGAGKLTIKNGDTLYLGTNARFHYYAPENGAWVYKSYIFTDAGLQELVWANHDIINQADGSVYLAASDPVLPEQPVITGVTLNQTAVSLKRGGTFQFSATVKGGGTYDTSVTYTVSGNSPTGGTTVSAAGLLTVGANETSPTITVTATSVQDPAFSQSAAVTVKDFISKLAAAVPQAGVVFDGTIVAEDDGGIGYALIEINAGFSSGDSLQVTFNGVTYTGVADELDGIPVFGRLSAAEGMPDFTEIPLCILYAEGFGMVVATETPGTYSLKAERLGGVAATSATVSFTCSDLLSTDSVYRIKAWVYEPTGYSYNGVILPELPEEPIGQYMGIMTCPTYGYRLWCGDSKFRIKDGDTLYLANNARFHYYVVENGAWVYKSYIFTDAGLQELVWANHDVVDFADSSLYLAASDPVRDDLDTTLPPAWTSDLFAGPSHSEAHTFSGLLPTTDYGVYSVITTGDTATEHHATVTFTTAESTEPILVLSANQVTDRGFDLYITRQGLEAGGAYTAEIVIFRPDATGIPFETVMSLTGNGVDYCAVTGLEPETTYIAEVAIHPASGGENILFGELTVTTGEATAFQYGFTGVEDIARRLRAAGREENGTARMLTVFFGGRNGLAQSL